MELKKYYLRNELVWTGLTDDQIMSLQESGTVKHNGKDISFAPRIAMCSTYNGIAEMYEVTNDSVFLNSILDGVTVSAGETGRTIGVATFTVPLSVVYAVRVMVSPVNVYPNNRFFPNIVDAIDYYKKVKDFLIETQNDNVARMNELQKVTANNTNTEQ